MSELPGARVDDGELCRACLEQWAATDLRDDGVQDEAVVEGQFDLAKIRTELKTTIPPGAYTLQVSDWGGLHSTLSLSLFLPVRPSCLFSRCCLR